MDGTSDCNKLRPLVIGVPSKRQSEYTTSGVAHSKITESFTKST